MKKLIKIILALLFLCLVFILLCNLWVVYCTRQYNYFSINNLPSNDVALVLGTSRSSEKGKENLFFKYRMEATARLFKEGKIKYIILSGNNDSQYYNEPLDMQRALLNLGIPENVMTLDFAGFRTFDSIIRCKEVFNQDNFTIISQNFHNARALYIAHNEGIQAISFAAQDVPDGYSLRTLVREYLARPKAVLDVHVLRPSADVTSNKEIRKK
ncbi:SanA protein [Dyadobacter arcticus]|uniref:SanA protein n=1 Tax=Dyadobacter arcticus TaxID=1078754 RepID=A0ABX0UK60_9BACT|nr:SanA protein [Dyadobacter arcticus]